MTFRPSPGKILHYHPPGGLGVRIDSAVYQGYVIPPYYDSLVGKLIVHGKTRAECLMRLRRALDEMVVDGIETTLPLFRALVREPGHHRRRLPHPLARAVSRWRKARWHDLETFVRSTEPIAIIRVCALGDVRQREPY